MKNIGSKFIIIVLLSALVSLSSCGILGSDDDDDDGDIVGSLGYPQFNLTYDNEERADLDLYVRDPNGEIIFFGNTSSASGGQLDIDCMCSRCPDGPNENIFWKSGAALTGTYEYWVDYFGSCGGSATSSNYTIRVMRDGQILETKTGSLDSGQTEEWEFTVN